MQEGFPHHCHEFGRQGVGEYQRVEKTGRSVENAMQHPRDQKFVQHLIYKAQVLHNQDGRRRRHLQLHQ